ncbi:bis(5'-nucleosyl)-tetraphosphatase (symmetrical) YqeK [Mycoplasmatota bacterium]|nr:bis(5'-nucleosyl)-tetraphosphatase (symmetrical) YqeK [Mycoplasmatota bacterium]
MNDKIIGDIYTYLNKTFEFDTHRLRHTFNVRDMALKLGKIYHADLDKLEIASLLHDFTKNNSVENSFKIASEKFNQETLDTVPKGCLHAYSAAVQASKLFSISDSEILDAITYHCSGRIFKSIIEQIVFISDYIEESRDFVDDSLREIAYKDLDLATYHIFSYTIEYLENKNWTVSSLSKEAYSYYKNKMEVINER